MIPRTLEEDIRDSRVCGMEVRKVPFMNRLRILFGARVAISEEAWIEKRDRPSGIDVQMRSEARVWTGKKRIPLFK